MVTGLHAQPHAILVPKQEVGKWHKLPEMGVKDVVVLHLIPDLATGKDVQYQQHQLLQQLGVYYFFFIIDRKVIRKTSGILSC